MCAYVGSFGIFRDKKVIHSKTVLPIGLVPHGIHVILGPKEFFSHARLKARNQCEISLFEFYSTVCINLFSWYLRAFSFDRNLKYVVGTDYSSDCNPLSEFNLKMFHLPTSDCSNVSSMHF